MLGPFVFDDGNPSAATHFVHAHHHMGVVVLSLVIAFVSCCAAMYMAHTNRQASTLLHRRASVLCASMVLGLGIWAMHFIGMLAMQLPATVKYDPVLTTLSIIPGMVAAWLALLSLQTQQPSHARIAMSGFIVGAGITVMHYCGIAAMELEGALLFHIPPFLLSAVLGVGFAILSLFSHRWIYSRPYLLKHGRLIPPALMTLAIASMHFISMYALRIDLIDGLGAEIDAHTHDHGNQMLSFVVAAMSGVVFLVFGLINALLRYRDLWKALAARKARLNAMIDTAEDGFISLNAQGLIQDFNPSAQRIFGYTKEEVMGRNISMLMPSPLAEQHDAHLAQHVNKPDKPINVSGREVLGKHKDGRHVPLQLSVGKAVTPNGTIFVGYLQDISQRKRTDAQLRIAASVFHHVREGVAIVDANHNISDVNPAFVRLMEMNKEQCVGRPLEQLYEHADMPPDMSKLWQTVAIEQYWQSEIMFTRTDGTVWMQRLSISPVLNELHRPHHFIAVISDVSERPGLEVMLPHTELHDSATGLPSQKLFMDRLGLGLLHARCRSTYVGLVVIKALPLPTPSIQPGSTGMDGALRLLAQLLQHQLRSSDTVGRIRHDQLGVLLPGIKDAASFTALVQRLCRSVQDTPLQYSKYGLQGLQLGHASDLSTYRTAAELMDAAQAACETWEVGTARMH